MNHLFPRIDYKLSSYISGDYEDHITKASGDIYVMPEDDSVALAGKCKCRYIDVFESGYTAEYLLDTESDLYDFYQALYSPKTSEFNDAIKEMADLAEWCPNLLVIDRIEILPKFRKRGLAKIAIENMVNLFKYKMEVVALKAFPIQIELSENGNRKATDWDAEMGYIEMEQNEAKAIGKLAKLYRSFGFVGVGYESYMAKVVEM